MMSFMILGSVIGFILYTYLGHVLMVRRLDREEKAREVREIIKRSALLFMDAEDCDNERRRSLINMFRGFKL
ncbi:unnamed protein product [Auanema sp. JU1783]|nr:unnamed protein product [Auanema sp. JU1783]